MTVAIQKVALRVAEETGYQLFDKAGCDTPVSEDLQDGRVIGERLTIRDPFASKPRPVLKPAPRASTSGR